jgi:3-oxoadipate enol-lactonase
MKKLGRVVSGAALLASLCLSGPALPQGTKNNQTGPGAYLQVEGSKIYFEECGSAQQTVVLIHDGVLDSAVWDDVWPELCKHFHTLDHPEIVERLVLVGAVVGGMPYSQHFLDRGNVLFKPLEKGDVKGAILEATKDKYLVAAGNDAAKKRMADLLTASPQDMTHAEFELPPKPALPRLHEIRVPTLLLTGDADIPDVHAHAGAIEAGIPRARRVVLKEVGHLMYLEKPAEFSRLVIGFIEQNSGQD